MCGIIGHISLKHPIKAEELLLACNSLEHRGPDSFATEIIHKKLGFAHTRLSFLDLGESGAQPMYSNNKSSCITFNGELYNYLELKEELKDNYHFKTTSDTEVILAAYETWGMEMLSKFEGMFAFALYDAKNNKTILVRDRFGIKPLYYYQNAENFLFASELKAFFCFSSFTKELNKSAFCDFFVYRYIPSPKTIWENTFKIKPAHYLILDHTNLGIEEIEYWKPIFDEKRIDEKELIAFVDETFKNSVKEHARADVPIGSFLSGGYDSSAIAAKLCQLNPDLDSFSIGFSNWEKSEDYFAKIVAKHLNINNKKVVATEESLDLIELMPQVYDEPIADISIIPTYMVSRLARKDVKAVMSGEGADELFAGYHWQKEFYNLSKPSSWLKKLQLHFKTLDTTLFYAEKMGMGYFDAEELKQMLHPAFHENIEEDVHWFYRKHTRADLSPLKSIQYLDMKCFMGELVLTKVDRASMANSLEVRVPFINHRLFEKIFSVDEKNYYKKSQSKFLLYENIKTLLPKEILQRKKQGFVGPDAYYMNKEWYKEQLKNSKLVKDQIVKQVYIDELLAKDYDWRIWKILVMEKWYSTWMA